MTERREINLDTATIDELKIAAFDNMRQIEMMQDQQKIIVSTLQKKEKEAFTNKISEKKEVPEIKKVEEVKK